MASLFPVKLSSKLLGIRHLSIQSLMVKYMGVEPKIRVLPPKSFFPLFSPSILGGFPPIFGNTHIGKNLIKLERSSKTSFNSSKKLFPIMMADPFILSGPYRPYRRHIVYLGMLMLQGAQRVLAAAQPPHVKLLTSLQPTLDSHIFQR